MMSKQSYRSKRLIRFVPRNGIEKICSRVKRDRIGCFVRSQCVTMRYLRFRFFLSLLSLSSSPSLKGASSRILLISSSIFGSKMSTSEHRTGSSLSNLPEMMASNASTNESSMSAKDHSATLIPPAQTNEKEDVPLDKQGDSWGRGISHINKQCPQREVAFQTYPSIISFEINSREPYSSLPRCIQSARRDCLYQ